MLEEIAIGTVVANRYRLDSVIGAGAAGVVYEATDHTLNRTVALKILTPMTANKGAIALERFRLETEVLASITHPNVVAVFDAGRLADGRPFLVMERLSGITLDRWLTTRGRLEVDQLFQVAAQLCRALRRVHARGVVHRDVKPANVIVTEDDEGNLLVKMIDFGVARLIEPEIIDPSEVPTHLTTTGHLVGSPIYMSPEQIVGDEVDPRTDVYSLGVTMYQLLTGRPPFEGTRILDILNLHLSGTAPPISQVAPEVECPPRLEQIILRCLSRLPEERYSSVEVLLSELRAVWAARRELLELHSGDIPAIRWDSEIIEASALDALAAVLPSLAPAPVTEDMQVSTFAPTVPPPTVRRTRHRVPAWLLLLGLGLGAGVAILLGLTAGS